MNTTPAPQPGPDQIILTIPDGPHLCYSLEHRRAGRLAEVIVTFGQMGEPGWAPFWPECWGQSYAMCGQCWGQIEPVVHRYRPTLTITGPPAAPAGQAPVQQAAVTGAEGQAWRS